jgi:hypothetical protein
VKSSTVDASSLSVDGAPAVCDGGVDGRGEGRRSVVNDNEQCNGHVVFGVCFDSGSDLSGDGCGVYRARGSVFALGDATDASELVVELVFYAVVVRVQINGLCVEMVMEKIDGVLFCVICSPGANFPRGH